MACRRKGDTPLSEPMMVDYWRIYASLGLNELNLGIFPVYIEKVNHNLGVSDF